MSDQNFEQNPQPGYGQQTNSLAVISLVSGIASYFIVPLLGAIVAIITGNMAKKEIRQSGGRMTGEGFAKWGVILGWINIGFALIAVCFMVLAFAGVVSLPVCLGPFGNMDFMQ